MKLGRGEKELGRGYNYQLGNCSSEFRGCVAPPTPRENRSAISRQNKCVAGAQDPRGDS